MKRVGNFVKGNKFSVNALKRINKNLKAKKIYYKLKLKKGFISVL